MPSSATRRHVRHGSLPGAACRTVEVTATLRHGAIVPAWFPVPFDGLLAAAARRRRLGASYGLTVDHHQEDLPLTSTLRSGRWGNHRWVWAATCATWERSEDDVRWIHKRPWSELQASGHGIDAAGTPVNPDVGRFKAQRIPHLATVTLTMRWWCLGDPDGVRDILADVDAIGKKTNTGDGQVTRWEVVDAGPPDWDAVMWAPDGRIARPFPARHTSTLGVDSPDIVSVDAYRPPYWRAPMHDGRRQPVDVVAPWTRRPA